MGLRRDLFRSYSCTKFHQTRRRSHTQIMLLTIWYTQKQTALVCPFPGSVWDICVWPGIYPLVKMERVQCATISKHNIWNKPILIRKAQRNFRLFFISNQIRVYIKLCIKHNGWDTKAGNIIERNYQMAHVYNLEGKPKTHHHCYTWGWYHRLISTSVVVERSRKLNKEAALLIFTYHNMI